MFERRCSFATPELAAAPNWTPCARTHTSSLTSSAAVCGNGPSTETRTASRRARVAAKGAHSGVPLCSRASAAASAPSSGPAPARSPAASRSRVYTWSHVHLIGLTQAEFRASATGATSSDPRASSRPAVNRSGGCASAGCSTRTSRDKRSHDQPESKAEQDPSTERRHSCSNAPRLGQRVGSGGLPGEVLGN